MREGKAISISAYRRDAVVKVWCGPESQKREAPKRGTISEFTDRSRGRLLFSAFNASCDWLGFAVLTYPAEFPNDGHRVKRDIDTLCKWVVREYDSKFLWGLEFQKRGAPHVNLLFDQFIPKGLLGERWFEIVGSGDLKHLVAGTRIEFCHSTEQAAGYMAAAYSAKKSEQKEVPDSFKNVGRFWGCSRGLVVPIKEDVYLVQAGLPKVRSLRKFTESGIKCRKVQPMKENKLRRRKVKRKPASFLHRGLQGFKAFRGSKIALRLIEPALSK